MIWTKLLIFTLSWLLRDISKITLLEGEVFPFINRFNPISVAEIVDVQRWRDDLIGEYFEVSLTDGYIGIVLDYLKSHEYLIPVIVVLFAEVSQFGSVFIMIMRVSGKLDIFVRELVLNPRDATSVEKFVIMCPIKKDLHIRGKERLFVIKAMVEDILQQESWFQ
ncbi:hypothetical protein VNO78_14190 [Psophocarpus tetragonolobus]|uniref:CheW-like domain-containing protein n=1 Tax=Psophocarpus tetragonolobus TaxID=3891 RepID=A0AAN9SRZ9_PSOTE